MTDAGQWGAGPRQDPPRIGIVALSAIADDPRVRRQGDAFAAAGWGVFAIGLPGARSAAPKWTVLDRLGPTQHAGLGSEASEGKSDSVEVLPSRGQGAAIRRRVSGLLAMWPSLEAYAAQVYSVLRKKARVAADRAQFARVRYALRLVSVRLHDGRAERLFWTLNDRFELFHSIGAKERPDIWLANDWTALPVARRLAREQGVPFIYDTHELASDEYEERRRWRLFFRPVVRAIERVCLRDASLVTCVSDGIADRLQQLYGLAERPLVIRNTPSYIPATFRPTSDQVGVLYHGIVAPGRGLEECIRSVRKWRPEFRLTIRGPVSDDYRAHLESEIAASGVAERVDIVPPVPMTALVTEASRFDVGVFALPSHSLHNRYALPNKFFEYVMAGLALCVSDLPEMGRIMRQRDLGVLIEGVTPGSIAAAINQLDRPAIDRHKRRSLEAARELNWEHESEKLVERCLLMVGPRRPCAV